MKRVLRAALPNPGASGPNKLTIHGSSSHDQRGESQRKLTQSTKANLKQLASLVREVETKERLLNEPSHLQQRIEALDRIEAYLLQLQPPPFVSGSQEAIVYHRATAIQTKLAAANLGVYAAIRNDIRQGHGRKSLLQWLSCLGCAKLSLLKILCDLCHMPFSKRAARSSGLRPA